MNQRIGKGMAALLVLLLTLQAPVALAFSCADHVANTKEVALVELVAEFSAEVPAEVPAKAQETDCHGKMQHHEVSEVEKVVAQTATDECCDDCSCPTAMSAALKPSDISLAVIASPELISTPSTFLISLHPDRILHPPIS
jgi:hypothetical protein